MKRWTLVTLLVLSIPLVAVLTLLRVLVAFPFMLVSLTAEFWGQDDLVQKVDLTIYRILGFK